VRAKPNIAIDKGEFRQGDVPAVLEFLLAAFDKSVRRRGGQRRRKTSVAASAYGGPQRRHLATREIDKLVGRRRNAAKKNAIRHGRPHPQRTGQIVI